MSVLCRSLIAFTLIALAPDVIHGHPLDSNPDQGTLPGGVLAIRDQPYVAKGHERQKLDLYYHADKTPRPLVIWIHGGAWRSGSKDRTRALRLLENGFNVASINYRLSQHAVFPAQIKDCKAAVRWLRSHAVEYGLDPAHFGAWGSSAGGHLVALLGVSGGIRELDSHPESPISSRVQAICDFFGPTDFLQMNAQAGPEGRIDHNAADSPESKLVGAPIQDHPELARAANPINYVSTDDSPFLILHGNQDKLVPWKQSQLLSDALKEKGVSVQFQIIEGAGHSLNGSKINDLVLDFFNQTLR